MTVLSDGEKLVWAAAFAAQWSEGLSKRSSMGMSMYVPEYIENACAAVYDLREALPKIVDGWGDDDETTIMLREILGDDDDR